MEYYEHNSYYVLVIGELTFYIDQTLKQYWSVAMNSPSSLDCIDCHKNFNNPENVKKYILKQLRKFVKDLSKDLESCE